MIGENDYIQLKDVYIAEKNLNREVMDNKKKP